MEIINRFARFFEFSRLNRYDHDGHRAGEHLFLQHILIKNVLSTAYFDVNGGSEMVVIHQLLSAENGDRFTLKMRVEGETAAVGFMKVNMPSFTYFTKMQSFSESECPLIS